MFREIKMRDWHEVITTIFYVGMIISGIFLIIDHNGGGVWSTAVHFVGGAKIGIFSALIFSKNIEVTYRRRIFYLLCAVIVQIASFITVTTTSLIVNPMNPLFIFMANLEMWLLCEYILVNRMIHIRSVRNRKRDAERRGIIM